MIPLGSSSSRIRCKIPTRRRAPGWVRSSVLPLGPGSPPGSAGRRRHRRSRLPGRWRAGPGRAIARWGRCPRRRSRGRDDRLDHLVHVRLAEDAPMITARRSQRGPGQGGRQPRRVPSRCPRRPSQLAYAYARYARLVRFAFLILIGRFATLLCMVSSSDAWSVRAPTHGQSEPPEPPHPCITR